MVKKLEPSETIEPVMIQGNNVKLYFWLTYEYFDHTRITFS